MQRVVCSEDSEDSLTGEGTLPEDGAVGVLFEGDVWGSGVLSEPIVRLLD